MLKTVVEPLPDATALPVLSESRDAHSMSVAPEFVLNTCNDVPFALLSNFVPVLARRSPARFVTECFIVLASVLTVLLVRVSVVPVPTSVVVAVGSVTVPVLEMEEIMGDVSVLLDRVCENAS